VLLSVVGLLISSYFTAIAYRWIAPDARWMPAVCRLGERTCASIVFTPRARLFGVPNSVLGQAFYLTLVTAVSSGWLARDPVYALVAVASGVTVAVGAYLSYSLLFITRVPCLLCFVSHAINLVVFVLASCP
jgi:uncharacterized membrane protein